VPVKLRTARRAAEDIVRTNFGRSPAVQLDLFFAASHSMEPGAHTVWMGFTALLGAQLGCQRGSEMARPSLAYTGLG
jgi:hypothetical protein